MPTESHWHQTRRLLINIGSRDLIRFFMDLEKASKSKSPAVHEKMARKFAHYREFLAMKDAEAEAFRKSKQLAMSRADLISTMTELMTIGHDSIESAIHATWIENKDRLLGIILDREGNDAIVTIKVSGARPVRLNSDDFVEYLKFPPYPVFVCFKVKFGKIIGHIKNIPEVEHPVALETGEPL